MCVQSKQTSKRFPIRSVPGKRLIFAVLSCLLFLASFGSAQEPLKVEWMEGRLSVTAEETPLAQVLQEVARQTGLEARGLERLQEKVSVRFSSLSLREGLQKLLAYVNYVILEKKSFQGDTQPVLVLASGRRTAPSTGERGEKPEEDPVVEEDQGRRLAALYASVQQGDSEALQKALFDRDQVVQATAYELLAKQDPEKAVAALLEATKSDQPGTRLQALQLLDQSGQAEARVALSALDSALGDEDVTVKGYAAQALVERGTPEAMVHLYRALHDPDPSFRMMVVEVVAGKEQGRQMLQAALRDDNEAVRSMAAFWLERASAERR